MGKLLPKDQEYFDLFEQLASISQKAAEIFCLTSERPHEKALKIKDLEVLADDVVHQIIIKLNSHRDVPLNDRHDIRPFVHNIDNIPDYLKEVSKLIAQTDLQYTSQFYDFGKLILDASKKIIEGVALLRIIKTKKGQEGMPAICKEINTIENRGDDLHSIAVPEVISRDASSFKEVKLHMLELKIIEKLEKALDQCEDVANFLETFQLKNA